MYVDIFGNSGSQQNYFRIYGKNICPVCNSKTVFEKINGRGTYYCPTCQPLNLISKDDVKISTKKSDKSEEGNFKQKNLL